jgi:hypothetical protein
MTREEFEARLLELWVTTKVPFTRANLQFLTGVSRKKLDAWTKTLVGEGVLESDIDDDGELVFAVPGAARPARGLATPADVAKLRRLKAETAGTAASLALALRGPGAALVKAKPDKGDKSLAVSGVLSFALGPLGWLYAGPWKTAVVASIGYIALIKLLPAFLLLPMLAVAMPVSALMGLAYAWRHNQKGERTPILPPDDAK